jgi:hypothetical protein
MSFKAVQAKIEKKEGVSKDAAGAILANASRNASPAAKKKNPKLKKVKGSPIAAPWEAID